MLDLGHIDACNHQKSDTPQYRAIAARSARAVCVRTPMSAAVSVVAASHSSSGQHVPASPKNLEEMINININN
jgi:hypothetical protein